MVDGIGLIKCYRASRHLGLVIRTALLSAQKYRVESDLADLCGLIVLYNLEFAEAVDKLACVVLYKQVNGVTRGECAPRKRICKSRCVSVALAICRCQNGSILAVACGDLGLTVAPPTEVIRADAPSERIAVGIYSNPTADVEKSVRRSGESDGLSVRIAARKIVCACISLGIEGVDRGCARNIDTVTVIIVSAGAAMEIFIRGMLCSCDGIVCGCVYCGRCYGSIYVAASCTCVIYVVMSKRTAIRSMTS